MPEVIEGYLKRQQDAGTLIRYAGAICDNPQDAVAALAFAFVFIGSHFISDEDLHRVLQGAIEDLKTQSPTH